MLSAKFKKYTLESFERGQAFELKFSKCFHEEGVPLLVSPKLLRARGCGQVDLLVIKKNRIVAAECKSGEQGPNYHQKQRLLKSCQLILLLFSSSVDLITVKRFAKSFDSAYPFKRNKIGELR